MLGLMQQQPLLISSLLNHAARHHGGAEVVSATGTGDTHHTTWARDRAPRAAACACAASGSASRRRIASARWPGTTTGISRSTTPRPACRRSATRSIPRLAPDDIAYIINHAGDSVLFVDPGFAPLIGGIAARIEDSVRAVVMMTDAAIDAGARSAAAACACSATTN